MADISFGIGGENGEFLRALKDSQSAVASATSEMRSSFEGITGIFESITGALGLFTAALAGGAAFKEAIATTVELTTGAVALGRQFGISATQASDLRVALDDVHVSTETFQAAGNALTKTLNTNEQAFTDVGIATRDVNGNFRNQLDILLEATDHLAKLKEGTDRNIEGQRLFGRAWAEVAPVVKLTSEAMRDAAEKAASLGLEVGGEQVAATQKYRAAMNDVGDVMTAVKNVIGQALMPVLTELGEWFGSIGPGLVESFRIAIAAVSTALRLLWLGLDLIYETGKTIFTQLAQYAITFGQVLSKAIVGDFSGAATAWRNGMGQIEQIGSEYWNKIAADATATQEKIVNSFATAIVGPKATPTKAGDGGTTDPDNTEKRKKLIEELADYAQDLDTRVTQEHARSIAAITALDRKQTDDRLEEMQKSIQLSREQMRLDDQSAAARLKGISTQLGESDRFLADQQRAAQSFHQRWGSVFSAVQTGFSSAISGMVRGTMTFGQAVQNIMGSVVDSLIQMFVKMGIQWVEQLIFQKIMQKTTAASGIAANAGLAASAAMASVAAIPFYGWAMAPAVGATTFAEALSYEAALSAAGGFDIPSGMNPVTQLHQREMVLPAPVADTVRDAMGRKGGGGRAVHLHANSGGGNNVVVTRGNLAAMVRELGHNFRV